MEAVMRKANFEGVASSEAGDASRGARMPLALAHEGDVVRVAQVKGDPESCQHLAELGFVAGSEIKVTSRAGQDVIVEVKGATLALNRRMAMRIMVI